MQRMRFDVGGVKGVGGVVTSVNTGRFRRMRRSVLRGMMMRVIMRRIRGHCKLLGRFCNYTHNPGKGSVKTRAPGRLE